MRFELGVISNEIYQGFNHNTYIFYETNGQVDQIKEHINPMPMHHKLNETKSHNQSKNVQ
jgi:hypothetical protein